VSIERRGKQSQSNKETSPHAAISPIRDVTTSPNVAIALTRDVAISPRAAIKLTRDVSISPRTAIKVKQLCRDPSLARNLYRI
jgi:hypothetical protein